MIIFNNTKILTITDTYRFPLQWSPEYIHETILMRFGGALSTPVTLKGVKPLTIEFFVNILEKLGINRLLTINEAKKGTWVM